MTARCQKKGAPAQAGVTPIDPAVRASDVYEKAQKAFEVAFAKWEAAGMLGAPNWPASIERAYRARNAALDKFSKSKGRTFTALLAKTIYLVDVLQDGSQSPYTGQMSESLYRDIITVAGRVQEGKPV